MLLLLKVTKRCFPSSRGLHWFSKGRQRIVQICAHVLLLLAIACVLFVCIFVVGYRNFAIKIHGISKREREKDRQNAIRARKIVFFRYILNVKSNCSSFTAQLTWICFPHTYSSSHFMRISNLCLAKKITNTEIIVVDKYLYFENQLYHMIHIYFKCTFNNNISSVLTGKNKIRVSMHTFNLYVFCYRSHDYFSITHGIIQRQRS